MTSTEFSESYRESAREILIEAESLFKRGRWHLVVRRAQEAVELFLKAILREAGIEVPRLHDVGSFFRTHADRFPNIPVERLVSISRRLREEREISFYGDDATETPPDQLYSEADARGALDDALWVSSIGVKAA